MKSLADLFLNSLIGLFSEIVANFLSQVPLEATNFVDQDVGRDLSSVQSEDAKDKQEDDRLNGDRLQLVEKNSSKRQTLHYFNISDNLQ